MSFITDLENEVVAVGHVVEDDLKVLAAMVWAKLKEAGHAGEAVVIAAVPGITAKLKAYAEDVVQSIAKDPAFEHAVGSWQFGAACARVAELVVADFPVLATMLKPMLQGVVETAVQAAFAAFTVGL